MTLISGAKREQITKIKNIIPVVKYGVSCLMIWVFFAKAGPGLLDIIEMKMTSQVYQNLLLDNVRVAVHRV